MSNRLKRLGDAIKKRIRGTQELPALPAQSSFPVQISNSMGSTSSQIVADGSSSTREASLAVVVNEAASIYSATPADESETSHQTDPNVNPNLPEVFKVINGAGEPLSILQGAHDLVINNPVFVSTPAITEPEKTIVKGLLMETRLPGGELDSLARLPQPICHPGTRQALRERTVTWLNNPGRESNLLWIHGPAGVGKSAVAQTIGQRCRDQGWLGTAFFLSRPSERDDPKRLVPTIAYQLSISYPAYQRCVTRLLIDEPTILEKVLQTQFVKLLTEPLFHIQEQAPSKDPIVIILDGLDECNGDAAQRQLIRLIGEFTAAAHRARFPLLWIVTSRPEWQIASTFADENHPIQCRKEVLVIHSQDAEDDVAVYLHEEFQRIFLKYAGDVFSKDTLWPSESQLLTIQGLASGLFVFASTVLRFIDDDAFGNPAARLNLCLDFLKGGELLDGSDPLNPLHCLYSGIMQNIHPRILSTTMCILQINLFTKPSHPSQGVANFLLLSQADFYASLRRLYSVLDIPPPQLAALLPVRVFHASFLDFVERIINSGAFGVQKSDLEKNISRCCAHWSRRWLETRDVVQRDEDTVAIMPWYYRDSYKATIRFSVGLLKEAWLVPTEEQLPEVVKALCNINFADFQAVYGKPRSPLMDTSAGSITTLLVNLDAWQGRIRDMLGYGLVRTQPECAMDRRLLHECTELINYNGMESGQIHRITENAKHWSYKILSLDDGKPPLRTFWVIREAYLNPRPMFFLLGYENNTCLVISYRLNITVRKYLEEAFYVIRANYPEVFTASEVHTWPSREDLDIIASISPDEMMGSDVHSSLIRKIVAFIGSPVHRNPITQLELIIFILRNNKTHPDILGSIRRYNLSIITRDKIPIINEAVSLLMTYPAHHRHQLLIQDVAPWLSTDKVNLNLSELFELLNSTMSRDPLLFPMRTVVDVVPAEMGFLGEDDSVWVRTSLIYINMYGRYLTDIHARGAPSIQQPARQVSNHIYNVFNDCWSAFDHALTSSEATQLFPSFRDFPFSRLNLFYPSLDGKPLDSFCAFVAKMWKFQINQNLDWLVRTHGICASDESLITRWRSLSTEDQSIVLPSDLNDVCRVQFLTLDHGCSVDSSDPRIEVKYFLLGHESNSCLVIASSYR